MQRAFCSDCGGMRPFKRTLGWGTFFAVLITSGFWLLALPSYPMRCTVCGRTLDEQRASEKPPKKLRTVKDWGAIDWIGMGLIGLLIVLVVYGLVTGGFK